MRAFRSRRGDGRESGARLALGLSSVLLIACLAACSPTGGGGATAGPAPATAPGGSTPAATLGATPPAAAPTSSAAPTSPSGSTPATAPAIATRRPGQLPLAGKVLPPAAGAYLGVYAAPAPFDLSPLKKYEALVGKTPAIVMWYQPWVAGNENRFDAAACWAILKRGAVPMITWEPWDPGTNARALTDPSKQSAFALRRILSGHFDTYIRTWARDIRDFGAPIMLRPMHEMNGNWYPWAGTVNGNKPAEYAAAWRHIHGIFTKEGATNVTWVWSINTRSHPATKANSYGAYYPGDSYVDWVGISGFNWGKARAGLSWTTFSRIFTPPLAYTATTGKPVAIAETGVVEQGGDKAAWLLDAYSRIRADGTIRAVVYFDARDAGVFVQDWRVNTSGSSLSAFREAISAAYFVGTAPDALHAWTRALTAADRAHLDALKPLY